MRKTLCGLVLSLMVTATDAALFQFAPIANDAKTATSAQRLVTTNGGRSQATVSFNSDSWDEEFDSSNDVSSIDVASLVGMPAGSPVTITGLGWEFEIQLQNFSWYSESVIKFGDDLANPTLFLQPGAGSDFGNPTTMTFSSGGISPFASNGLADLILADGVLDFELYETLDDAADAIDAMYIGNSSLTFDVLMPALPGDYDNNGLLGCSDINALSAVIAAGTNDLSFDLTNDNLVNSADLDEWLDVAGDNNIGPGRSYIYGDANLNGVVDGIDFTIWSANKFTANTNWCDGNFNANAVIDGIDFSIWSQNKFTSSRAVVPEPGLDLCLTGFVTMILLNGLRRL